MLIIIINCYCPVAPLQIYPKCRMDDGITREHFGGIFYLERFSISKGCYLFPIFGISDGDIHGVLEEIVIERDF